MNTPHDSAADSDQDQQTDQQTDQQGPRKKLTLPDLSGIATPLKRRPRSLKHGLVDLDDVDCVPGPLFINWINITKTKLMEREKQLLIRRIDTIKRTIRDTFEQFNEQYLNNNNIRAVTNLDALLSEINMGDFIAPCIEELECELNNWEGTKSKKVTDSTQYRQYFRFAALHRIDVQYILIFDTNH